MPANIYDLEWEALIRSGKLREWFENIHKRTDKALADTKEVRQLLDNVRLERDIALKEVDRLRAALKLRDSGYKGTIAIEPPTNPAPIASVVAIKTDSEALRVKESDLDDAATRFKLLELD